jgi:hypothetical protein
VATIHLCKVVGVTVWISGLALDGSGKWKHKAKETRRRGLCANRRNDAGFLRKTRENRIPQSERRYDCDGRRCPNARRKVRLVKEAVPAKNPICQPICTFRPCLRAVRAVNLLCRSADDDVLAHVVSARAERDATVYSPRDGRERFTLGEWLACDVAAGAVQAARRSYR